MQGKCIDLSSDSAQAAGLPTMANEHSISLRCQWVSTGFICQKPRRANFEASLKASLSMPKIGIQSSPRIPGDARNAFLENQELILQYY